MSNNKARGLDSLSMGHIITPQMAAVFMSISESVYAKWKTDKVVFTDIPSRSQINQEIRTTCRFTLLLHLLKII